MVVYSNDGNPFVALQVPSNARRILDIGCGCGDMAALLKKKNPDIWIEGITFNSKEAIIAATMLDRVHAFDIELPPPAAFQGDFDCLIFSHVLEHLREPAQVIGRFLDYVVPGGLVIIAVPNVLEWRTRFRLLRGHFTYADYGVLDRTHLKFFTFNSVDHELLTPTLRALLHQIRKFGDGAAPLGPLRRLPLVRHLARLVDGLGVYLWPNLFSQQVMIVARKRLD